MAPYINTSRQSPNHSSRVGHPVRLCLLHATVGLLKSSLDWLCNPASRVSSHYVISKTGVIYQLVAETEAAWHAGNALWQGETEVNEISIGIELENRTGMTGYTGQDPYPDVQVQKLLSLARNLVDRYPTIAFARHLDVAIPKGRKTDPKGFDWTSFRARLAAPRPAPTPPAPPIAYRALGIPIYERSDHIGPLWGHLTPGEHIVIDDPKNNHLADGRGFLKNLDGLEAL